MHAFLHTANRPYLTAACIALFMALAHFPFSPDADARERDRYAFVRERGAYYLQDYLPKGTKIELLVLRPTHVFGTVNAERHLGTLLPDKKVELEAISEFAYRVRGEAEHGIVVGWVTPKNLAGLDPSFADNLQKMIERQEIVDELIANRQIAIGMTQDEVNQVLGSPNKREGRVTAEGRVDRWEYIQYEEIPQYQTFRDPYTGGIYRRYTHTERIEKGKIAVDFTNGVVSAMEEMEERPRRRTSATIVPVPVELKW